MRGLKPHIPNYTHVEGYKEVLEGFKGKLSWPDSEFTEIALYRGWI